MRQRRQRLQVSTFPFLAVLLCAMGSLILLLLVMDRRAKVVARAKATRTMEQALARAMAEEEKAAAAQRAEWERRRQMLHEQLLQQDQQVLRELQGVQNQAATAAESVQKELARSHELQEELHVEHSRLARSEDELTARRGEVASAAQHADASRADLARLSAELERLEQCLADLKAARQRQQQMYSLVPYHGKRGDNRKPIYIECTGAELIFHPDRLALHELTLSPAGIRDEIDRRLARQRSEVRAVNEKPGESAYLLMLIRPNGIATYYRTLAALAGLRIDFGYEFIDQDWILDFSDDDKPKKQPWLEAARTKENRSSSPAVQELKASRLPATGRLQRQYEGLASGSTGPGQPIGILPADTSGAADPLFGNGEFGAGHGSNLAAVQSAGGRRGEGSLVLGTGDQSGSSFAEVLADGSRFSAAQRITLDGLPVRIPHESFGQSERFGAGIGAAEGKDFGQSVPAGIPGAKVQPSDSRVARSNEIAIPQVERSPDGSRKTVIEASPSPLRPFAPTLANSAANPGMNEAQEPASESAVRISPAQGRTSSGESARALAGDPLDRLAAQTPQKKPRRAEPSRPGPLIGNRDWIIPIDCTAAGLVTPYGQRIATAELSKKENGSNPLLETIQRMIARRQATVRPGEPPYRPMVRFRVYRDGLLTYHLAYPALEALHVPMSRENVDPEEEKAANRER